MSSRTSEQDGHVPCLVDAWPVFRDDDAIMCSSQERWFESEEGHERGCCREFMQPFKSPRMGKGPVRVWTPE